MLDKCIHFYLLGFSYYSILSGKLLEIFKILKNTSTLCSNDEKKIVQASKSSKVYVENTSIEKKRKVNVSPRVMKKV